MTIKRRYRQISRREAAGAMGSAMRNLDRIVGKVPATNPECPVNGKPCTSVDCTADRCRASLGGSSA